MKRMLSIVCLALISINYASAQDPLFAPAVNYAVGTTPFSVFAADYNNDGYNDLAVANFGDGYGSQGTVSILMNNGHGTFQMAVNDVAGISPSSVFAADLDRDGDNDLAMAKFRRVK